MIEIERSKGVALYYFPMSIAVQQILGIAHEIG